MKLSDFKYDLPEELIAQYPSDKRGDSRMMLLGRENKSINHHDFTNIVDQLNPGDALYFSHGFSIVYKDQTKVIPPDNVDVIMVAPKGSGTSLRRNFLSGAGINSSFAVDQDATGRARDRCIALGIAIGSGYLFPTTFELLRSGLLFAGADVAILAISDGDLITNSARVPLLPVFMSIKFFFMPRNCMVRFTVTLTCN